MRRSDREITDKNEIVSIIRKCGCCRLALCDGDAPYIVPLNFGCEYENGELTLYFHCAKVGKKLDIIAKNPKAAFEVDCSYKIIQADKGCEFSCEYESVVGFGKVEQVSNEAEKLAGLKSLMRSYAPTGKEFDFTPSEIGSVAILRLSVSEFTGKRLKQR